MMAEPPDIGSAAQQLGARVILTEMRAGFDGELVVLKGLEIALRHPDPSQRLSGDVDVLTDRPDELQQALLDDGYEPWTSADLRPWHEDVHHHLVPLFRPGLPGWIEVHRSPGWLAGMTPPSTAELIAEAVPSRTGIDGVRTLRPAAHAVYVAVHSWRDRPFSRRRDLDDVAVLLETEEVAREADRLAARWGVRRIWSWYRNAGAAAAGAARPKPAVRFFGGVGHGVFPRSALGDHAARSMGRLCVDRPLSRWRPIARGLRADLRPQPGERLRDKLTRVTGRQT